MAVSRVAGGCNTTPPQCGRAIGRVCLITPQTKDFFPTYMFDSSSLDGSKVAGGTRIAQVRLRGSSMQHQRQSDELLSGARMNMRRRSRGTDAPHRPSTATATAMEAAGIQQSLSRTQALLKSELERVSHVSAAIQEDGKLLQQTNTLHQTLNVKGAKNALTALERSQQREHRILLASVTFFWVAVMYILWERLLTRLPFVDRILRVLISILNKATTSKQ